jgi:hypothetical protein
LKGIFFCVSMTFHAVWFTSNSQASTT